MVKPIKPDQVTSAKAKTIAKEAIEAFNEMIKKYFDGDSATFTMKEVANLILKKMKVKNSTYTINDVYKDKLLDVEDIYINIGWEVEYDGPAYNETYEATFTFTKK